jgi:hypothetical protein
MTRKDYEQFAAILAQLGTGSAGVEWLADQMARVFAADNERFDHARFYRACGLNEKGMLR